MLTAGVAGIGTGNVARADLTWEHTGSVRFSGMKQPLVQFKSFTNMTPQRTRILFKYDASAALGSLPAGMEPKLPGSFPMGGAMPTETAAAHKATSKVPLLAQMEPPNNEMPVNPLQGSVTLVQRFDDGQFIGFTSFTKQYVGEPIKEMLEKTRFDPWKKLAPKLSKEEPPSFTPQQRARLGAEVRALIWPFMKSHVKTYFRALPEKRTFNGIEGHGYRFTTMINTQPPFAEYEQWVRLAAEWWVADNLPGDEVVGQVREAAVNAVGRDPKRSTSIWMNEMPWVMWEMLPEEVQMAAYTLMPRPDAAVDSPEFRRANTPLYAAFTIVPPPEMKDKNGDLRMEVKLTKRSLETLPDRVWQAPADYKRVPLDDIMKQFQKLEGAMPPLPLPGGPPM
jgi:hypothetical protein